MNEDGLGVFMFACLLLRVLLKGNKYGVRICYHQPPRVEVEDGILVASFDHPSVGGHLSKGLNYLLIKWCTTFGCFDLKMFIIVLRDFRFRPKAF